MLQVPTMFCFFAEHMSGSQFESVPSTSATPSSKTQLEDSPDALGVIREAVVVLTRLPDYKISALRPPTPPQFYSEDESLSSSDSDMQCEPEGENSSLDLYDGAYIIIFLKILMTSYAYFPIPQAH